VVAVDHLLNAFHSADDILESWSLLFWLLVC
jgi:hypothetical protein